MGIEFIQEDRGGTLTYCFADIPEDGARWDAATTPTVTIYSATGGELQAAANATAGPSTTLSDAAAADQTTIPLTATTNVKRGRQYVIGPNTNGQWEWVTIEQVGSTVSVRDDLQYTYASGDAFKSHDLELTLSAGALSTTYKNCRAEWSFTVDSVARYDYTNFHVSKYAPKLTVTPQHVLTYDATALHSLGTHQRLYDLISEVWHNHILVHIGQMFDPSALISGESLHLATVYKVLEIIAAGNKELEEAAQWRSQYAASLEAAIIQAPVDLDQSGGIDDDETVRNPNTAKVLRG